MIAKACRNKIQKVLAAIIAVMLLCACGAETQKISINNIKSVPSIPASINTSKTQHSRAYVLVESNKPGKTAKRHITEKPEETTEEVKETCRPIKEQKEQIKPRNITPFGIPEEMFEEASEGIYVTQGIEQEYIEQAIKAYEELPDNIRKGLESENCRIYLHVEDDEQYGSPISGERKEVAGDYYAPDHEAIVIEDMGDKQKIIWRRTVNSHIRLNADNMNAEQMDHTLFHEVGHFVDESYNGGAAANVFQFNASYTEEVNAAIEEEKDALRALNTIDWAYYDNDQTTIYLGEYFAESFSLYMADPELLYNNCPKIYEEIENIINSYDPYAIYWEHEQIEEDGAVLFP